MELRGAALFVANLTEVRRQSEDQRFVLRVLRNDLEKRFFASGVTVLRPDDTDITANSRRFFFQQGKRSFELGSRLGQVAASREKELSIPLTVEPVFRAHVDQAGEGVVHPVDILAALGQKEAND